MILQVFVVVVTDPISTLFLFRRFGSIGAWSVERILLIYAIAVGSYGLAEGFLRGFDYFPHRVNQGIFDKYLLRPRSLLVQVSCSYFHLHRFSRVFTSIAAVFWLLVRLQVPMTARKWAALAGAFFGGFAVYSGVLVATAGIACITIQGTEWINLFTNISYQVTRCPIDYMPQTMRQLFTFLLPILVFSYYPAAYICGWGASAWQAFLAIPVGVAFLFAAVAVWRAGVRRYQSTGS